MITRSERFLVPLLPLPKGMLRRSALRGVYIGDKETYGEYMYLRVLNPTDLVNNLDSVLEVIEEDNNTYVIKLDIPDEVKEDIIQPFIKGKYSEFPENYRKRFCARAGGMVGYEEEYLVITKADTLREYWEERLDVELPEGAEVESIPDREEETIFFT